MSTTDLKKELETVLENMVNQRLLSLDGVAALSGIKQRLEEAERELKTRLTRIDELKTQVSQLEARNRTQSEQLTKIADREKAVAEREAKVTDLEKAAAVSQARASTFEQAMRIVFAPNTVRNGVQAFIGNPNGGVSQRTTQTTDGYSPDAGIAGPTIPGQSANLP